MHRVFSGVVLVVVLVYGCWGWAYDLPPVNLGFTSFLDGGPPAGPGWYYQQYMQFWSADKLAGPDGSPMEVPIFGDQPGPPIGIETDSSLSAWISLSQLIYQSDQELFMGGKWGLNLMVPHIWLDLDTGQSTFFHEDPHGVGDLVLGPYLQWDPIMGKDGPVFMHRLEFQLIFPTGDYDPDYDLNPGSNIFSFNPYWSGTWFFAPKWSTSVRAHYLWNDTNDNPAYRFYQGAESLQPGEAIHLNFSTEYELISKMLHVGLNGYYLDQISDSKLNGVEVSGRQERVLGIGPGFTYHLNQDQHFFFNWYVETEARNRPEGNRFTFRYVHHFK